MSRQMLSLLNTIAGTVVLSIENARFSEELKKAYREATSLNRAKDKVFHHLSHELKTPISVLDGSLKINGKASGHPFRMRTGNAPWKGPKGISSVSWGFNSRWMTSSRISSTRLIISSLPYLDQCADELEVLIAEQVGEGPVIGNIRNRIEEKFGSEGDDCQKNWYWIRLCQREIRRS